MDDSTVVMLPVALFVALPAIFGLAALVALMRARHRHRNLGILHAPLLSEADAGFLVCPGCAFDNFTRFTYCCLCGATLSAAADDKTKTKKKKRGQQRLSSGQQTVAAPSAAPTATQLRVRYVPTCILASCDNLLAYTLNSWMLWMSSRKRKEWVRKVDVDSNLFWYRNCVDSSLSSGNSVASQDSGFVAVLQHSEASAENESISGDEPVSEEYKSPRSSGEAVSVEIGNDVTSKTVTAIDALVKIEVVPAAQVDLTRHFSTLSTRAKSRIIKFVFTDFPTKYAHFVVSSSALITNEDLMKLTVHRDFTLEHSIDSLSCVEEKHTRLFMRVNFVDENGVDAGGVHREWFMQVNELLLAPQLRVFVCTNKAEQSYYLNPSSAYDIGEEDHLTYYFVTGRLIGRALLEGTVWGFHLAMPLIKIILGIPVTFSDLEYLDPATYRSMVWIRDNDGVEHLGLDFSVTEKRGDAVVTLDLIPNGRGIDVTDANKHEYLERKFHYMVFESVSSQLAMLLKGLHEVIPQELLMLFDAEEFAYLLCGTQEIDVDDWEAHSQFSSNLRWTRVLTWFWEVVREMPNEYRRRLLLFATGSSRVPLSGFAGLTSYDGRLCPFTLEGVPLTNTVSSPYISSHACFNRLELPLYKSKEELQTVLMAILDTEAYGFTTA